MRNLFKIVIFGIAIISFVQCQNKNTEEGRTLTILGEIEGLEDEEVVLLDLEYKPIDTVQAHENRFELNYEPMENEPVYQEIYIPSLGDLRYSMKVNRIGFFTDGKQINISGRIGEKGLEQMDVEGSSILEEKEKLERNFPSVQQLETIVEKYNEAFDNYNRVSKTPENHAELSKYSNMIDSLYDQKKQDVLDVSDENENSVALAFIAYNNFYNERTSQRLRDVISHFSSDLQKSYYLQKLEERADKLANSEVGAIAPDFNFENERGEKVKLSSFRGKYVLIDFWASWCGPCIKEIPNVIRNFNEFKDDGLEVIAVSIDDDKEKWAAKRDQLEMPYVQLFDEKKETMETYQYDGIPFMVLISPEGKIVEKGATLRGENLKNKLIEYLQG